MWRQEKRGQTVRTGRPMLRCAGRSSPGATPGSREGDKTTFIGSVWETGSMKGFWVCELTGSLE